MQGCWGGLKISRTRYKAFWCHERTGAATVPGMWSPCPSVTDGCGDSLESASLLLLLGEAGGKVASGAPRRKLTQGRCFGWPFGWSVCSRQWKTKQISEVLLKTFPGGPAALPRSPGAGSGSLAVWVLGLDEWEQLRGKAELVPPECVYPAFLTSEPNHPNDF